MEVSESMLLSETGATSGSSSSSSTSCLRFLFMCELRWLYKLRIN
ncbi:hypothetical protein ACNSPU_01590 [Bacillus velezensis]